jgi:hypothetical protein
LKKKEKYAHILFLAPNMTIFVVFVGTAGGVLVGVFLGGIKNWVSGVFCLIEAILITKGKSVGIDEEILPYLL